MTAPHPFNRNFWLAAAALALVGGLAYGQVSGLNDDLDGANTAAAVAAGGLFSPDRMEVRKINFELEHVDEPSSAGEFDEIDAALEDL